MIRDLVRRVMLKAQARGLHRWAKRVLPAPVLGLLRRLRAFGEGGHVGGMLARQDAAMAALEQRVMREVSACVNHFNRFRLDMLIRHDDTLSLIEQRLARQLDDRLHARADEILERHDQVLALIEQKLMRTVDAGLDLRMERVLQWHDQVLALIEQRFWRDVESRLVQFREQMDHAHAVWEENVDRQIRSSIHQQVKLRLHEAREQFLAGIAADVDKSRAGDIAAGISRGHDDAVPLSDREYAAFQDRQHNVGSKRARYEQFIASLAIRHGPLLDIGCGDGSFLEVVRDCGIECVGIDSNRCMVEACLDELLEVHLGDAVEVMRTLPDASFEAVVSLHVVEHLSGPALRALLSESVRLLRPGGVLAFETPKVASVPTLADHYFADPTHRMPRHHSFYGFLLEQHGLVDVRYEDVRADVVGKLGALPPLAAEDDGQLLEAGRAGAGSASGGTAAVAELQKQLVAQLEERLSIINEALFVPRDVRVMARKPGPEVVVLAGKEKK